LYNSIQDTLIIGKKVIYLPTCHSTNDIAAEIVHAGLFAEGTVVITDNQVQGRGQRGTTWLANAGENLTFSVILTPEFIPIPEQFLISQMTALALRAYVHEYVKDVKIKWPNDIHANGRKISGVLIENSIQGTKISGSTVGIGLNINQMIFSNDHATSLLKETNADYVLADEFHRLLKYLDSYYNKLRSVSQWQSIRMDYLKHLYGYNEEVKFLYRDDVVTGYVTNVTPQGKLCVKLSTETQVLEFALKEIQWVKG
jgi:BirA family biotin operon repressor/biotin-[acetyl-CoA-carboxylase] ligase